MAVFDCTMFFNENDLFEIRLNQHWDFVDRFIVVEAGETHTGLKKPFNFDHKRFRPWASKIEYRTFDSFEETMRAHPELIDSNSFADRGSNKNSMDWARDGFQGNYAYKVLAELGAEDEDIILASCCDETIKQSAFDVCCDKIKHNPELDPIFMFKLQLYAYKFNALWKPWQQADTTGLLLSYKTAKKRLIATVREHRACTDIIDNAGWHFCSMDNGDGDMILQKFRAWGHSRDIVAGQKQKFESQTKEEAMAIFLEDVKFNKIVEINYENHPAYIVDHQEKFKDYILPVFDLDQ
jgi:beta-1,4-mannosyl-glycoprotein beta-1,4-N-acetylglucosaminyltransferase